MKKATLADVAALADVSKATVSRYLKEENVKAEIAERIAKAIEETGYVAKTVKKVVEEELKVEKRRRVQKKNVRKSLRAAVFCRNLTQGANHRIIEAIKQEFYANGSFLQIYLSDAREDLEETYLTSCIVNNLDVILMLDCSSVEFIQKQMRTTAIPVIYLKAKEEGICSVAIDEMRAAELLGEYLMQRQHLMIRYLGNDVSLANLHMEGIKEAYRLNKQPHDFAVKISDGSYLSTFEKIKELFAEQTDLLILEEDEMAIPLVKYIQEYHVAVPQNVSVVSFGGSEMTRVWSPVMTCVVYDYAVYAQDIYRSALALMEHRQLPERQEMFYLQEGDSVR